MSSKRFRIAFSFAGEKRNFVAQVVAILAERFGEDAILYDKYHEAEFARYDLGIYLPKLYGEQSELIVPILCANYDNKRWTGWEWMHIYSLLTKGDGARVMPCRFDYASADGLTEVGGFIELDDKTPAQLASLILERLALNQKQPKDYYTKPAAPSLLILKTDIPHNLPTLQPFFGREEELKKISDALDPESRTWGALIDGPGGMGKTSLAVRAAYDASPSDFKKIVFVSLKTRELDDDGVRDLSGFILTGLSELFGELARELGYDNIGKAPEDQRARLLLDSLRGKQTLLVLDNLESLTKSERDQLFTFVKRLPQGCKAILTSRGRIGSAAEELILEKLSEDAALATLAELATHNPLLAQTSEAERLVLYRETGGKPLLLRWTAGQIGRGHCLTFTDALHYLRSCTKGNDPLEFIFGDLVEDFSVEETKILSAFTYFTLPAKAENIAALTNPLTKEEQEVIGLEFDASDDKHDTEPDPPTRKLSEAEITRALRSLINRSLVVPSEELQTFALVPMVAEFLRKARPEVVEETGNRLEKRAFTLILENGSKKHERFPLLDAVWPSAAAALPRFLAGPNDRLQMMCTALDDFLDFTGRWDEWVALSQQAESKALAAGDYQKAGWRAQRAGWVAYLRRQGDAVLACAERAAAHWKTAKAGAHEQATAIRLRGLGYQSKQDFVAAIAAHREALDLWRTLSVESEFTATAFNDIAGNEKDAGDFVAAERDYREALRLAKKVDYAEGVAYITGNLATLALDREDWQAAEPLAREALNFSENVGRQELIGSHSLRMAEALIHQDKGAEALPYAKRAVEIYARLGSPNLEEARKVLGACEGELTSSE